MLRAKQKTNSKKQGGRLYEDETGICGDKSESHRGKQIEMHQLTM